MVRSRNGVEGGFAGEKPATVVVARDVSETGQAIPGVNANQGVEGTAARIHRGHAFGRRSPLQPKRVAAEFVPVIRLVRLPRGSSIDSAADTGETDDAAP